MKFDAALRRYKMNVFTDADVTRCTGLSVRAWRELIKIGAVRTIIDGRGPGRVRTCDATAFKRAAVIATLNRTGFSLHVSGQIAYFLPYHTLLYEVCDPRTILLHSSADADLTTAISQRIEQSKFDWFDPDKPAKADPETDWLIEIYDGRFVGVVYKAEGEPLIFGDLREVSTKFVAWFPLHRRAQFSSPIEKIAKELQPNRFIDFVAEWENPVKWSAELDLIDYKVEKHTDTDPLRVAAIATAADPVFSTTINISLALRMALRRYLRIDPLVKGSKKGIPCDVDSEQVRHS